MTEEPKKDGNGKAVAEMPKPSCFVVSPIGAPGSPERKHANVTLKFIIEPVLERCGFEKARRADTLGDPGIISRQIISELLNADLVIADLTGHNPNVFYELAIRHGTGKPFVQLLTRGQTLPFDVLHQRTIFFDRTDLDDVEDCKAELERQVKAVMASTGPIETPIGQTLDYEKLRTGGPVEQALAKLTDQVASMNQVAARPATWGESYWGQPEPKPTLLSPLIKERTQKFLNDRGFVASVPTEIVGEIIAEVQSYAAAQKTLSWVEIDVVIQRVVEQKLIGPRKTAAEAKLP